VFERAEVWEIGVSLATPEKIRKLQRALYVKAKQAPTWRFHFLYDKVSESPQLLMVVDPPVNHGSRWTASSLPH
jgi:hypothetical protein